MASADLKTAVLALLILSPGLAPADATAPRRDWEDPAVSMRGVEPPHATLMPFATIDGALTGNRAESPFHLTLNGTWRFHWAPTPEASPALFHQPSFDDRRLGHDSRALQLGDGGVRASGLP